MKCPKCHKEMIKVTVGHDNWWYCEFCGKEVGKKEESEKDTKDGD